MTSQIKVNTPAYAQILHRWRHLCDLANAGTLTRAERKEMERVEYRLAQVPSGDMVARLDRRNDINQIAVGARVTWTHKRKQRSGTVEGAPSWSPYAFVRPDKGPRLHVLKDKLHPFSDTDIVQAVAALPQDDAEREDAIYALRMTGSLT